MIRRKRLIKPLVLAVDFDGVIAQCERWKGFNVFGPPIRGVKKYLQKLREEGWIIIVWTVRPPNNKLKFYLNYFEIPYDAVNRDVNEWFHNPNHKIFAHVYFDDKDIRSLNKRWKWWRMYWRLRWRTRHLYERGRG